MSQATEFWGLLPGGALPDAAKGQVEQAIAEAAVGRAISLTGPGRPDIPATLDPDTATRVNAAPSGAVFRSTNGPQGAWEWQKRGSAWVVTQGDTGLIDCSEWLTGGWVGTLHVGRKNNEIRWHFEAANGSAASTTFLINKQVSNRRLWDPELLTRPLFQDASTPTTIYRANLAPDGRLSLPDLSLPFSTPLYSTWLHHTTLPWPLTLTP